MKAKIIKMSKVVDAIKTLLTKKDVKKVPLKKDSIIESKYRLLKDDTLCISDKILYRIEALRDFSDVKKGDKGWLCRERKESFT